MRSHDKIKGPSREEMKNLVEAVGGISRLREILHFFYKVMSTDLMIGFFFDGKNLEHISLKQSEFMLMAAGLIEKFEGKGPSTAHVELAPILSGHFDRRLVLLEEVLNRYKLSKEQVHTWLSFEESFRKIVVTDQ